MKLRLLLGWIQPRFRAPRVRAPRFIFQYPPKSILFKKGIIFLEKSPPEAAPPPHSILLKKKGSFWGNGFLHEWGLGWRSRADIWSIRLRIAPRHFLIFKKSVKIHHNPSKFTKINQNPLKNDNPSKNENHKPLISELLRVSDSPDGAVRSGLKS